MPERFHWCSEQIAEMCTHNFIGEHVHICITSPNKNEITPPCGGEVLHLKFWDLGERAPRDFVKNLFNSTQAKEIVAFVKKHDLPVVVNCEAGVSRSAGVVLALRRHYRGDTEEVYDRAIPNIYVASILSRELGREHS